MLDSKKKRQTKVHVLLALSVLFEPIPFCFLGHGYAYV